MTEYFEMSKKKYEIESSGSTNFDTDKSAAAIDKAQFCIFFITKNYQDDNNVIQDMRRARKENKPMIFIIDKTNNFTYTNLFMLQAPSLVGTVNHYGDMDATGKIVDAIVSEYLKR